MAWPDAPEELLAGPRGRRLCLELVSPWREDAAVQPSPGWHDLGSGLGEASPQQLAAELAALVSAADLTAIAAVTEETGMLGLVRSSVDAAMYWQPPDQLDRALAEPAAAAALGSVARRDGSPGRSLVGQSAGARRPAVRRGTGPGMGTC